MKTTFFTVLLLLGINYVNSQSIAVPYINHFDDPSDELGWTHYAFYGNDDWEIGTPAKTYFSAANSTPNAWVTKLTGNASSNSSSALETPFFDLTNVSTNYILSFAHKRHNTLNNNTYKLEYSFDGITWTFFNPAIQQKTNWQTAAGFSSSNQSYFEYSAIRLTSLQGQDSVKFRFRFTGGINAQEGWIIDDFSISEEYINLQAAEGDTINDITRYFTSINVKSNCNILYPYQNTLAFSTSFYLSNDSLQDAGDVLLGNVNINTSGSLVNWSNTFPLPPNLSAGTHYVVYRFDSGNSIVEANEADNNSFAVLIIDSIYQTDYFDDLETAPSKWSKPRNYDATTWQIGDTNTWHVDQPISGNNALIATNSALGNYISNKIASPYLDLSLSTNTSLCFWYKQSMPHVTPPLVIDLPLAGLNTTYPFFNGSNIDVPPTRKYGWDCFCVSIATYDGELATRFRIASNTDLLLVDDIYIGAAKADAAIVDLTNERFTSSAESSMTFKYDLYNAGLSSLPAAISEFYWSTDSLYDAGDLLIATINEPVLTDTSFVERSFTFTKPTTINGDYFLIYKLDVGNTVDEMQEINNSGWFKIHQIQAAGLPYINDFSVTPTDWSHGAFYGADEWVWDPAGIIKADTISTHSNNQLYSPIFDFTELTHPVLEFDYFADYISGELTLLYTTDGGKSWNQLKDSSVISQKRMYNKMFYGTGWGVDITVPSGSCSHLNGWNFDLLVPTTTYRGRDYDDDTRFVYDLQFLQGLQSVQFMFDHANLQNALPITIDNFSITEAQTDLMVPTNKSLLATSADDKITTFFSIKNNANYMSMPATLELYCSVDSLFDVSDVLVQTQYVDTILPYQKRLIQVYTNTPPSFGNYNYLLYRIQQQSGNETTTMNNIGGFPLSMNSSSSFSYPLLMDFNSTDIDGWSWRCDSTGGYPNHRFRHQTVTGDPTPLAQNGQWFLDPIDQLNYWGASNVDNYPVFHLESPAFDFSNVGQIQLSFDFLCVGVPFGNYSQGGNLSYSIDGGTNWIVLTYNLDPAAVNWYDSPSLYALNNQPGWGDVDQWTTAIYHLSFLGGQPNVRFRFNYRGEYAPVAGAIQGFRLDNFIISASSVDLVAQNMPDITASSSDAYVNLTYQLSNTTANNMAGTITGIYWSEDATLDASDELLYQFPEPVISPGTYSNQMAVYFPHPVTQSEYYIFYKCDLENSISETNEQNNVGRVKVLFNPFNPEYIDLEAVLTVNEVQDDLLDHYFPFSFQYINNGNYYSEPSEVKFYWSDDATLDAGDVVLYTIEEPVLNGGIYNMHSGDIYYPTPITQQDYYMFIEADANDSNDESDESNNQKMVHILFDLTHLGINEASTHDVQLISASESLIFSMPDSFTGNFEYSLYSASGQLVKYEKITASSNVTEVKKPQLSPGVYFVRALCKDQLVNLQFIEP